MFRTDLFINKLKNLSWKTSYIWFWISLIIWMFGIGGPDLYALPALIGLILLFRELIINDKPLPFISTSFNHSIVKIFYVLLVLIVLVKTLFSLYSFRWNILDVGSYSSVVFNFSNGLNYNSFLQIPSTAEHTATLLFFFAILSTVFTTFLISFTVASDVPPNFTTNFKSVSPEQLVLKFFNSQHEELNRNEFGLNLKL